MGGKLRRTDRRAPAQLRVTESVVHGVSAKQTIEQHEPVLELFSVRHRRFLPGGRTDRIKEVSASGPAIRPTVRRGLATSPRLRLPSHRPRSPAPRDERRVRGEGQWWALARGTEARVLYGDPIIVSPSDHAHDELLAGRDGSNSGPDVNASGQFLDGPTCVA